MKEMFIYSTKDPYRSGQIRGIGNINDRPVFRIHYVKTGEYHYVYADDIYYSPANKCMMYDEDNKLKEQIING